MNGVNEQLHLSKKIEKGKMMWLNFSAFVWQLVSFVLLAFWFWMFIDYLFNKALEGRSRLGWGFVLLIIPFGAIPYYCLGRSQHHQRNASI